jgi:uncharacterized protein (UPF0548 family)
MPGHSCAQGGEKKPGRPRITNNARYGGLVRRDVSRTLAELARAELTYPQVGATGDSELPDGYGHVFRDVPLAAGRAAFERAADGLLGWDMHRAAGFTITSTSDRATPAAVVVLQTGPVFAALSIPCRVVYTVEQSNCQGFAYGTLPGHPEQGEEAFLITIADDNRVRFRIRAFSRPAGLAARWGGPLTRLIQRYATDRYVNAMRGIAAPDASM